MKHTLNDNLVRSVITQESRVKIAKLCTALCSIIRRGHERENASLRHPALCSGLVRLPTDLFSVYQLQSRPFRPQFKVCNKRVNMYRFMVLISILLATVANAMPRYLIVPIENVRFINGPQNQLHHRVQRSAWPQDDA